MGPSGQVDSAREGRRPRGQRGAYFTQMRETMWAKEQVEVVGPREREAQRYKREESPLIWSFMFMHIELVISTWSTLAV